MHVFSVHFADVSVPRRVTGTRCFNARSYDWLALCLFREVELLEFLMDQRPRGMFLGTTVDPFGTVSVSHLPPAPCCRQSGTAFLSLREKFQFPAVPDTYHLAELCHLPALCEWLWDNMDKPHKASGTEGIASARSTQDIPMCRQDAFAIGE